MIADRATFDAIKYTPNIREFRMTGRRLLRRTEASKYLIQTYNLPCAPKTLAKIACVSSDGPPFRMVGRFPFYDVSDLDVWAQSKIGPLLKSTSNRSANASSSNDDGADPEVVSVGKKCMDGRLQVRCDPRLLELVERTASSQMKTSSEFIRDAVIESLRRFGAMRKPEAAEPA